MLLSGCWEAISESRSSPAKGIKPGQLKRGAWLSCYCALIMVVQPQQRSHSHHHSKVGFQLGRGAALPQSWRAAVASVNAPSQIFANAPSPSFPPAPSLPADPAPVGSGLSAESPAPPLPEASVPPARPSLGRQPTVEGLFDWYINSVGRHGLSRSEVEKLINAMVLRINQRPNIFIFSALAVLYSSSSRASFQ